MVVKLMRFWSKLTGLVDDLWYWSIFFDHEFFHRTGNFQTMQILMLKTLLYMQKVRDFYIKFAAHAYNLNTTYGTKYDQGLLQVRLLLLN